MVRLHQRGMVSACLFEGWAKTEEDALRLIHSGKLKIIKAFIELMKGRVLEYPLTTYFRCERVRFTPDTPCTAQLDGELYTDLEFDVKICRGLRFFRK